VRGTLPGSPPLPRPGERPAGRGSRPEAAPGDREHRLLRLATQADPVEELAPGEPVQGGDGVPDRVAGLAAGDPVPAAGTQARSEVLEKQHA